MLGSDFVRQYAAAGLPAWEAAAVALAKESDGLCPWPWIPLELSTASGLKATLQVQSDVLAVGTPADSVRLPLRPSTAQAILNDSALYPGALLPTPWIAYQIWRAAKVKLAPTFLAPNPGANLTASTPSAS
jgi:hypothetical protein